MNSTLKERLVAALWIVVLAAGLLFSLYGIGRESFWYDESYTGSMMRQSMGEVVSTIAGDTHPPLYFIALKLYSLVVGTGEGELRSFSALGLLALAALGWFAVRRLGGNAAGIAFALLAFLLPINHQMAQEARNYTWTAFLTTGAFLYGLLALRDGAKGDWVRFGLFALAACYTHNFGLFTAFVLFLVLIVWQLFTDRKKALKLLALGAGVGILYLPWLFVLLGQASRVGADYWIPPVTSETMWSAVFYPYAYKSGGFGLPDYSAYAVFLMAAILVAALLRVIKTGAMKVSLLLAPLAVWGAMLAFAFVVSDLFRPIFVLRYAMAFSSLFVLAFAFGLASFRQLPFAAAILAILFLFAGPQLGAQHEWSFNSQMRETRDRLLAENPPEVMKDAVFVHNNEHALGCFTYYFPENEHFLLLDGEVFKGYGNYSAFKPNATTGRDYAAFIEGRKTVFVVDWLPAYVANVPWYAGARGSGWRAGASFTLPEPIDFQRAFRDEDFRMPKINLFYSFRVARFDAEPGEQAAAASVRAAADGRAEGMPLLAADPGR